MLELDLAISGLLASLDLRRSGAEADGAQLLASQQTHEQLANEACYLAHMALPARMQQQGRLWFQAVEAAEVGATTGAVPHCAQRRQGSQPD